MVRLRSLDVLSCAKVSGILHATIGLLAGLFLALGGTIEWANALSKPKSEATAMFLLAALMPFLYGALGFVAGALTALLYNWIAAAIGGIKMELEAVGERYLTSLEPSQTANSAG